MLRKLQEFEYMEPSSLAEAISLVDRYGDEARVLAGGTDLLVWMKEGRRSPRYLINIKGIPGLGRIDYDEAGGLRIGALAKIQEIGLSAIIQEKYRALHQAARELGSPQVRNIATLGGNLCTASPSAETAAPLLVLNTRVKLQGVRGSREVPLEEFFQGPGATVMDREIMTEVRVGPPPAGSRSAYRSISRRAAVDLAIVGVAAAGAFDKAAGKFGSIQLALGAVAPTPMRAYGAEEVLAGGQVDAALIEEAARRASEEARPISDLRASEWYRREMVKVLVRRSLEEIAGER